MAIGSATGRTEVEPLTNYVVGRLRKDLGRRAGVGIIATAVNRDLRDPALSRQLVSQAYVTGVDGHLFLDHAREWVVTSGLSASYVAGSEPAVLRLQRSSARYYQQPDATHLTLDPNARSLAGWNLQVDFNRNAGDLPAECVVVDGQSRVRGQRPRVPDQRRPGRRARRLQLAQAHP